MAWKVLTLKDEEVTIEVDPAVDLAGGRLRGLYTCRARALTAPYVRQGAVDVDIVLVSAATDARAIEKICHAIETGMMVRRDVVKGVLPFGPVSASSSRQKGAGVASGAPKPSDQGDPIRTRI